MEASYEEYLANLVFEYLPKYFSQEEIETILADKKLYGPHGIRRELGQIDICFFAQAYFPQYFTSAIPAFHLEMYSDMEQIINGKGGHKYAIASPRGSAKTTLWDFVLPAWCALYRKKRFIILISDSSSQAESYLGNIKEEVASNEYIIQDFGKLQGATWRMDEILLKNDVKIAAKGSGKAIRGLKHKNFRPDLFIIDDAENDENVESEDQRKKLESWFDKAISKAGDEKTDIIVIGTILHYDSLLSKLLKRPGFKTRKYQGVLSGSDSGLWDEWERLYTNLDDINRVETARFFYEENKVAMLEGVKVLWPEKVSYYDYRVMILDEGIASFNSEVQNEPINPADCPIREDEIIFYDVLPDLSRCAIIGAVDPSMGKTRRSDKSAIAIIAKDEAGYMYVLESDGKRRHPDIIIEDILKYAVQYPFQQFGCETIQFQELFAHNLRQASAKNNVYLNIIEIRPTTDKVLRIMGLMPLLKNGYLRLHRSQKELVQELCYLGKWKTDDEADALQMAVSLVTAVETEFEHSMMPNIVGVRSRW